jgi:hypothetical protein
MTTSMEPGTRWAAELFDQLPVSTVLMYGYGMGEAVVVAAERFPQRIAFLVEQMRSFTDDELLGRTGPDSEGIHAAVNARNALVDTVTEIVRDHPKRSSTG